MKIYSDCDYFNENQDDEFAPQFKDCEFCYRYDICKKAYDEEHGNSKHNLKEK